MDISRVSRAIWKAAPPFVHALWMRLENSPAVYRMLNGAFWSLVGSLVSRALALAAAIVVARVIGRLHYGEWGIIQSTVGMFGTLAGFGMGTTAAKFVAELRKTDPQRSGNIIALSSIVSWGISSALAAVLAILAAWLCSHTLAAPSLTGYLQASAPLLLLTSINGAQFGVLSGFEAFKSIARNSLLTGLVTFPMVAGGAIFFGMAGVIGGTVAAQGAGCLFNLYAIRREARAHNIKISYRECMSEMPVLWRFSIPAVLAQLLISVVTWVGSTILVRQPNGYNEMGTFSAANQWFNALLWLPSMLNSVLLPVFSERLAAKDKANTVKLLVIILKVNALVLIPLATVGAILSPYIMASYGPAFRAGWPTLVAVQFTAMLLAFNLPIGQLISASGQMWFAFLLNIGWSVVFLGMAALFATRGSLGLASARLAAYFVQGLISLGYVLLFLRSPRKPAERAEEVCAAALVDSDPA